MVSHLTYSYVHRQIAKIGTGISGPPWSLHSTYTVHPAKTGLQRELVATEKSDRFRLYYALRR